VHPTKAEVRFREQSLVHEAMRRALADALGRAAAPELTLRPSDLVPGRPLPQMIPGVLTGGQFGSRWLPEAGRPASGPASSVYHEAVARAAGMDGASPHIDAATAGREVMDVPAGTPAPVPAMRPLIPLGQFRDTFIIAVDDEGLAIIDQHVAHERVLYERVMQQLTERPLDSQRMLVPLLLELAPAEREALLSRAEALQRMGFEVEDFGGDAVRVSATPAVLPRDECEAALRALASDLEGLDRGLGIEEGLKRIAALTACHAAVKANDPLTYEKMVHILEELRATAYSTVCPHGRPVMLRLTRREIEKNFERI
jgi:DNA mismatch repair protein MutL